MHQIFAQHLHRNVILGGRYHSTRRSLLHFDHYTAAALPAPPASCDYSKPALPILRDVMGNDQLGCCVIAAGYHGEGIVTANAGTGYHATLAQIIADYHAIGGYVPGNPSTDQGSDPSIAIQYWTTHGFANGTKLLGSLNVDCTNKTQVMQAIYLGEKLFIGLDLPDKWVNSMPNADGFIWDVASPNPNNGHMIKAYGYNATGVLIDTWGLLGTLTWKALALLGAPSAGGEVHLLITPDIIAKGQTKAPNGFDWTTLVSDFDAMGGNIPIPAAKTLTLAQVQALLTANWPK